MTITITCADAVAWAQAYTGPKFHAMLCDPPYHLTSIVKRFGGENAAPAQYGKDGVFARSSKGFMGKQWDGGDIAFDPSTWYAFSQVLHPGAFGMAFASSRGWHRLAVAIEDAGFIIHPSLFGWAYGSGFPKATRIDTQIDKAAGAERKDLGVIRKGTDSDFGQKAGWNKHNTVPEVHATEPATDLAKAWAGYRYGLQALKPALEPIIVFQKPYEGRPIDNITQYGAGALNIDGGRIATNDDNRRSSKGGENGLVGSSTFKIRERKAEEQVDHGARWPSNFILCNDAAAQRLDEQSGQSVSVASDKRNGNDDGNVFAFGRDENQVRGHNDAGGASRFFYRVQEQIDASDPVHYCAKASGEERDAGIDCYLIATYDTTNLGKEVSTLWQSESMELAALLQRAMLEVGQIKSLNIVAYGNNISAWCLKDSLSITKTGISKITESKILNWLTHLLTSDCTAGANSATVNGGNGAQSVMSGNGLIKKIGISQKKDGFHITDVARAILGLLSKISSEKNWQEGKSIHPTVKPLDLARYLATLLLPPTEYAPRRLFVPFAGVGSECIGAWQAGWEEVQGVELTEEYLLIAEARVKHWLGAGWQLSMFGGVE